MRTNPTQEEIKKAFAEASKMMTKPAYVYEYKLMYFCGIWMTAETLWGEDDNEAIYDADRVHKTKSDKWGWALFCGKRIVKKYNYTDKPYEPFCIYEGEA